MSGIQGTFGGALSPTGAILTRNLVWNADTLAWENATGGATPGANVKVTNFPVSYSVAVSNFPATQNAALTSPVDIVTGGVVQIDTAHHEVHDGEMFSFCEATDLGNGAVRDVLLVTPDTTKEMHVVYEVTAELELDLKFYEGTTASNNGTGVTAYNRKRSGTPASPTMALYHTPYGVRWE